MSHLSIHRKLLRKPAFFPRLRDFGLAGAVDDAKIKKIDSSIGI